MSTPKLRLNLNYPTETIVLESLTAGGTHLTAGQARQLAKALLEDAEQLEVHRGISRYMQ